ncbi:hypothetical protein ACOMCU_24375 [Lysinibacillus sp. UGB7]|uniref:hypothetical protein n=1 Tax=Lysinibacillus sp. UGB7 TaxID=3411039 RepID=UPI003B7E34E6
MPTNTTNFNLEKPNVDEFYDVGVQNANMDKIDTVLKTISDEVVKIMENESLKTSVLERGANTVNTSIKTLTKVTALQGRTIVNHVPLFDSGVWTFPTGEAVNWAVDNPKRIVNNVTDGPKSSRASVRIAVKPNTTYTVSCKHNQAIGIYRDKGMTAIKSWTDQQTFTFDSGVGDYVELWLGNHTSATGVYIFENASINEGTEVLPFVANIKGITNPTLENVRHNLIPAFNYNASETYIPGWLNLDAIDYANVNATSISGKQARLLLPVVPGTKYTFSCTRNAQVKISTNNGSQWEADQLITLFEESAVQNGTMNCTFTVPEGAYFIRILFTNPGTGFVAYPMMVKGTVAAPYKEQVREALTLKTSLHAGDSLRLNAQGQLVKSAKVQVQPLTGDLPYFHVTNKTGLKQIGINAIRNSTVTGYDPTVKVVKYNGLMLETSSLEALGLRGDVAYINGNDFRVSIANTDSGWGPNYAPTAAEIKAYFMGWTMFNNSEPVVNDTPNPYNGTGEKGWLDTSHKNKFNLRLDASLVVPTRLAKNDSWWQPFKLIYDLQTPVTEVVETAGSVTLDEGENLLVVSEGRIVREVANPVYEAVDIAIDPKGNRYNINNFHMPGSELRNKAVHGVVRKNGKVDTNWVTYGPGTSSSTFGDVYQLPAHLYDPTAVYTVDYIPLEPYQLTAPTNPIAVDYAENLGSALQLVTTAVARMGSRLSTVESRQNFRFGVDEGGPYVIIKGDSV